MSSTCRWPSQLTRNAAGPEPERQEVQPGLVDGADHLAEEHVHVAGALEDDGVEPEDPDEEQQHRHEQEHHAEGDERRRQEFHQRVDHRSTSRITSCAWL